MIVTILLVEKYMILRQGLRIWLETFFPQCRLIETTTMAQAVSLAKNRSPDLIIIDVDLPDVDRHETLKPLATAAPPAQIVIFTNDEEFEISSARAGTGGANIYFLSKDRMLDQLEPILTSLLIAA